MEFLSQGQRSDILLNKIEALLIFDPLITLWGHFKASYFKMLNDARVASACLYVRTCQRVRNSKNIATIRDFQLHVRVNSTTGYAFHQLKKLQFRNIILKSFCAYDALSVFFLILDTEHRPVRLVGGSSKREGRVEVFFNNNWGTVCHDHWGATDAEVVCRQLGLQYGNAQPVGAAVFGEGSGQIWLDDVACSGSESFLDECFHSYYPWGRHNCDHSEDAGVICTNGKYLNYR